jgi:rhamnopyranosyl-N-acetylglucosaminyl-diphospho-decaprenol beta-1,3/1,4-galactofuranosyltransferase
MDEQMRTAVSVGGIVVTQNRLTYLKKCIASLRSQTRAVQEIIVINNDSNDGTSEWLAEQKDLTVIHQKNSGSSGGQLRGIKEAYQRGHEWFWCMDDDTIPTANALLYLLESKAATHTETGFLCSYVTWQDGTPHRMNTPSLDQSASSYRQWAEISEVSPGSLPVKACSFVSVMFHRKAVEKCGLPLRELFIWYDDVEYTRRISTHFKGYQIYQSRVLHDTLLNEGVNFDLISNGNIFKYKHGLRNRLIIKRQQKKGALSKAWITIQILMNYSIFLTGKVSFKNYIETLKFIWKGSFLKFAVEKADSHSY